MLVLNVLQGETADVLLDISPRLTYRYIVVALKDSYGDVRWKTVHAFISRERDQKVKQHLIMSSDRSLNEAISQTLKLEVAKTVARPPARLQEVTQATIGK